MHRKVKFYSDHPHNLELTLSIWLELLYHMSSLWVLISSSLRLSTHHCLWVWNHFWLLSTPFDRVSQPPHYRHLGPDNSLLRVHLKMFSCIPGLCPLDGSSTLSPLSAVKTKNVFIDKWALWGKTGPSWETPALKHTQEPLQMEGTLKYWWTNYHRSYQESHTACRKWPWSKSSGMN